MRPPKYLLQLIVFTLLVGSLPVLILGWYSYHSSSRTVQEKVNESTMQLLRQNQLRVEQLLKTVDNSITQLLNQQAVAEAFARKLGPYEFRTATELSDNLNKIQRLELGISDIYMYSFDYGWLLSNSGLNQLNDPALIGKLRGYARMQPGAMWVQETFTEAQRSLYREGEQAIVYVKKWPINSVNPRGVISVVWSGDVLSELAGAESETSGEQFIADEAGVIVAHQNHALLGRSLAGEPWLAELAAKPEEDGLFTATLDGREQVVVYRRSPYNGWTYIATIPRGELTRQAQTIGWTSIWVSLGVLLVIIAAACFGSRRMYYPVQLTIESLRSRQSELQYQLKGQQQHVLELFVRKLLLGEGKPAEAQERLAASGFADKWESKRVILLQIDSFDETPYTEKDRDLLLYAIANIAGEIAPKGRCLPPTILQDAIVLVAGARAESEERFKAAVLELSVAIQKAVKRFLSLKVSVGVSRSFAEWSGAGKGFAEGTQVLKYRARLGDESVLFMEELQPEAGASSPYPKEQAEAVLDAVKSLELERADAALSDFLAALSTPSVDYNDYQLSLARLLVELIRRLEEQGVSLQSLKTQEASLLEELLAFKQPREIKAWLLEKVLVPGIALLEALSASQFKSISEEVKGMIRDAFDTDLTLEKCAVRLNYNPQYISRVFRQETGVNFADYLAAYRLDMAKKWLSEGDETITDIAVKLKYNNPANFIRYFRKMEGMTPGQYREKVAARRPAR